MTKAEHRAALVAAIVDVAAAAAELAVIRIQDAGPYETDCAFMAVSRSSDKLDEALAAIFGDENNG
jgi:hypothetical protein